MTIPNVNPGDVLPSAGWNAMKAAVDTSTAETAAIPATVDAAVVEAVASDQTVTDAAAAAAVDAVNARVAAEDLLTETTASSTYAKRHTEAFADFAAYADGTPAVMQTGQPVLLARNNVANADLRVVGGELLMTTTEAVSAAGYLRTALTGPSRVLGTRFRIATATGPAAEEPVVLIPWTENAISDAAAHLSVGRTSWTYAVWDTANGGLVIIGQGTFSPPLSTGPGTSHRMMVALKGDRATVMLPDGTLRTFVDARIATTAGKYAGCELYYNNASTADRASILSFWAGSELPADGRYLDAPDVMQIIGDRPLGESRQLSIPGASGGSVDNTIPIASAGPSTELHPALRPVVTYPPSGLVECEIELHLQPAAVGDYFAQIYRNGGLNAGVKQLLVNSSGQGVRHAKLLIKGTPGRTEFLTLHIFGSAVGSVRLNSVTGRHATFSARPIGGAIVTAL